MKAQHACAIPRLELPEHIKQFQHTYRCPVCYQRWQVTWRSGFNSEATRYASSGFKNWLWQRRQKKALKT